MAHKLVTFERGWEAGHRLYAAECVEPGCGAIVAGCSSRSAAREALSGHEAVSLTNQNAPDAGQGVEGSVPTPTKEHENMSIVPDTSPGSHWPERPALPAWATTGYAPGDWTEQADGVEAALVAHRVSDAVEVLGLQRADGTVVEIALDVNDRSIETPQDALDLTRDVALGTAIFCAALNTSEPLDTADHATWSVRDVEIDAEGFVHVQTDEPLTPRAARELAAALVLSAGRAEAVSREA